MRCFASSAERPGSGSPCSASTLPPMQFPAQPKPRLALHETMQSRAQCPSLPRSTAEIHANSYPGHPPNGAQKPSEPRKATVLCSPMGASRIGRRQRRPDGLRPNATACASSSAPVANPKGGVGGGVRNLSTGTPCSPCEPGSHGRMIGSAIRISCRRSSEGGGNEPDGLRPNATACASSSAPVPTLGGGRRGGRNLRGGSKIAP